MKLQKLSLAKEICRVLDERLADPVQLWRNPELAPVADYFIIAGVTSKAHMNALEYYLRERFKKKHLQASKPTEGKTSASWRVVDAGFLVVHLMDPEARSRYRLEDLWSDARQISWRKKAISSKKSKKT